MSRHREVEIITEAKPHTIKKFELIENYVDEWARKILGFQGKSGYNGSKGVIYIDCMCNSGVYHDENGNLVDGTALRVAKRLNEIIQNYPGKDAILLFNDKESERVDFLQKEVEKAGLDNVKIHYYREDCNLFLRGLDLESLQKSHNTLLLYDPYNASIDWEAVTPFLNRWGEVIFNHMVSDTSRGASQARKQEVVERYQETYQQDIQSIIDSGNNKNHLNKIVIDIIIRRMEKDRPKQYIATFPFFSRTNGLLYNLIYCSYSIDGFKLFKKVAWKTFGNKSSLKNTHGNENQLMFNLDDGGICTTAIDEDCYFVKDIADDIFQRYSPRGTVKLTEIYEYLDIHPRFPSDGYKDKIKSELKSSYGVVFHKNGDVIF